MSTKLYLNNVAPFDFLYLMFTGEDYTLIGSQ